MSAASPSPAALRKRRYRARKSSGLLLLTVEMPASFATFALRERLVEDRTDKRALAGAMRRVAERAMLEKAGRVDVSRLAEPCGTRVKEARSQHEHRGDDEAV